MSGTNDRLNNIIGVILKIHRGEIQKFTGEYQELIFLGGGFN